MGFLLFVFVFCFCLFVCLFLINRVRFMYILTTKNARNQEHVFAFLCGCCFCLVLSLVSSVLRRKNADVMCWFYSLIDGAVKQYL